MAEDHGRLTVDAYVDVLDRVEALAHDLDGADWDLATGCPGWSVKDNISHVVGVESTLAGDDQPDHQLSEDLPHVTDEAARFVEIQVDARRSTPVDALRSELRDVFDRRRTHIREADLDAESESFFGPRPNRTVFSLRTFDVWAHDQDIRRATARPGDLTGPAAEVAHFRIGRGLERTLPERIGRDAPLRIEITGVDLPSLTVPLGEDVPDGAESAATVRIGFAELCALACGRSDAPDPDTVEVAGDESLARTALAAFGFTP